MKQYLYLDWQRRAFTGKRSYALLTKKITFHDLTLVSIIVNSGILTHLM